MLLRLVDDMQGPDSGFGLLLPPWTTPSVDDMTPTEKFAALLSQLDDAIQDPHTELARLLTNPVPVVDDEALVSLHARIDQMRDGFNEILWTSVAFSAAALGSRAAERQGRSR